MQEKPSYDTPEDVAAEVAEQDRDRALREQIDPLAAQLSLSGRYELVFRLIAGSLTRRERREELVAGQGVRGLTQRAPIELGPVKDADAPPQMGGADERGTAAAGEGSP